MTIYRAAIVYKIGVITPMACRTCGAVWYPILTALKKGGVKIASEKYDFSKKNKKNKK